VKAALVAAGIGADRLATKGFGQTRPVASNDTEMGRSQNRRVEIVRQ
jgi:outer membrane protein OmpA-like peptidoglycan-associated protein